jgi:hypothetical protein
MAGLFGALPESAEAQSGAVSISTIAACKDRASVAVTGSSTYANNRLEVNLYYVESGQWKLLRQVYTQAFGSGTFSLLVPLLYASPATEGETLRVDVQLQRSSGGAYVDVGSLATMNVSVADRDCVGKCNVTVDIVDKAPVSGMVTVRSHYGSWFRPEGRLHGAMPVVAGQKFRATFVGLPCDWSVRVWYYPKTGDRTPKMLPAQYWPNEFQVNALDVSNPYTTSFAKGLKATQALETDDPYAAR